MEFRAKLLATLRAVQPILDLPGVLVIGSEVPNLLQNDAASTLVVSQDVDIGIQISGHAAVKASLADIRGLSPSPEEPSVWVPDSPDLIEVNFVGMDETIGDASETYVFEDSELPLLVFGPLSFMRPAEPVEVDGLRVPVPRVAGLVMEKLVTDRSGEKGDRDLLVVLGLLLTASPGDLREVEQMYRSISPELRYTARANLSILSLLRRHDGMPDPERHRARIAALLNRLANTDGESA